MNNLSLEEKYNRLLKKFVGLWQRNRDLVVQNRKLKQLVQALGDDNRHHTGEEVGRSPTDEEMVNHYFRNGGPDSFRKTNGHRVTSVRH